MLSSQNKYDPKISPGRLNPRFYCILILMSVASYRGTAQQNMTTQLPSDIHRDFLITFFERDQTIGSLYLAKGWNPGVVELYNHKRIPETGQSLLMNFDKVHSKLYVLNHSNEISSYPSDSVLSFELVYNNTVFTFEKIPWISDNYFLMPLIRSTNGYSLYKRLFTKLIEADFSSEGYYTTGKKYDEYVDYYEYYVIYPGNTRFRKLYLKEKDIRKALKYESKLLDDFFSIHDNEINEQALIGIIQFVNDKKYQD